MKTFALVLVAALGSAPAQQPDSNPAYAIVPAGTTFTCQEPQGCMVMNKPLADHIGHELERCQARKEKLGA